MMRPLAEFPLEARRRVRFVLTDIDDTLTSDGRLGAAAYRALERLGDSSRRVVAVTGRPAGWCDMIARFWPVDAVVGENGAFYFRYDHARRRMTRRYFLGEDERVQARARLDRLGAEILAAVPGAGLAADQAYRIADLAIDFREDCGPLPQRDIDRIVALFEAAGATAKVSSIHVNGWFGAWDKLAMTRILFREAYGLDLDAVKEAVIFIGDSPNDAPMFAHLPNAVAVANIRPHLAHVATPPTYVTGAEAGAGFVEFADALLS
ncbi:MAG TPA: HAD-IIB family hydrolase [Stellaceae bacterium]